MRLHERCPHGAGALAMRSCGHGFCKMCASWVHLGTQVVLAGPGPVIQCNWLWDQQDRYACLFGEKTGRTSTSDASDEGPFGGRPECMSRANKKYGAEFDLLDDAVYARARKEVKGRSVF